MSGFTSKQIDALQQKAEADDAFLQAFGQDYPTMAARVQRAADYLKAWADSNPVPEGI